MNIYTLGSHSSSTAPERRSSFARELMLAEFGKLGHLHDDQWADHDDISAEQLAQKRKQVLWSGVAS